MLVPVRALGAALTESAAVTCRLYQSMRCGLNCGGSAVPDSPRAHAGPDECVHVGPTNAYARTRRMRPCGPDECVRVHENPTNTSTRTRRMRPRGADECAHADPTHLSPIRLAEFNVFRTECAPRDNEKNRSEPGAVFCHLRESRYFLSKYLVTFMRNLPFS